jgi:transcriptional regulator with XRE-family HTH domain
MAEVMELMSIGSRLKESREQMGLTRAQLASEVSARLPDSIKVTARAIETYERDDRSPPLDKVAALCDVLQLDPLQLFAEIPLAGDNNLMHQIKRGFEPPKIQSEQFTPENVSEMLSQVLETNKQIQAQLQQDQGGNLPNSSVDGKAMFEGLSNSVNTSLNALDYCREENLLNGRRAPVLLKYVESGLKGMEYSELLALALDRGVDMARSRLVASRISGIKESPFLTVEQFNDSVNMVDSGWFFNHQEETHEEVKAVILAELEQAILDRALFGFSLGELGEEAVKLVANTVEAESKGLFQSMESYLNELCVVGKTALLSGKVLPSDIETAISGGSKD